MAIGKQEHKRRVPTPHLIVNPLGPKVKNIPLEGITHQWQLTVAPTWADASQQQFYPAEKRQIFGGKLASSALMFNSRS